MPLSNASRLADFGTGIGTAGAIIQVDNANQRLGVGTTAPTATLGVAGIVSATAFYGDGSNLDGVASAGLGTALSEEEFNPLTVIYQTSDTLSVGATITVDPPDATTKVAYTQYAEVKLEGDADLIVADGDDFIPDILGLSTEGFSFSNANGNGIFDTVYTDNIENAAGRGAPNFPLGITVSGISTLSGNVSIGGTLTYEDVTNVDSIGVVTARSGVDITSGGLDVTAGGIDVAAGGANIVGVVTATSFSGSGANLTGIEAAPKITLNAAENINAGSAVVVNSSGQFTGITSETVPATTGLLPVDSSDSSAPGVELVTGSSSTDNVMAYDPDNGLTLVMYQGSNNASTLGAFKVTSNGETWTKSASFGELTNQQLTWATLCYAGQGKFVAFYIHNNAGRCRIVSVNSSTLAITVGSEINLGMPTGNLNTSANAPLRVIWHPPTNKIVFVFRETGDVKYMASTGTMNYGSNTIDNWGPDKYTIFSQETQIDTTYSRTSKNLVYDPDSEKIIFSAFYNGTSASYSAATLTINSNGSITVGARYVINTDGNIPDGMHNVDYDTLHNKVIFTWRYSNAFYVRSAIVNSSTGVISQQDGLTIDTGQTDGASRYSTMTCDGNGLAAFFYSSTNGNVRLKIIKIASNGTLTLGSAQPWLNYSGTLKPEYSVYDSQVGRVIMEFYESSGDTHLISAKISKTNTTSAGYVGIANTTVTTGQSLIVRTFGSTSAYHTGLSTGSTYYIQSNGNFSTTADETIVVGGVALNGTTMLVKS